MQLCFQRNYVGWLKPSCSVGEIEQQIFRLVLCASNFSLGKKSLVKLPLMSISFTFLLEAFICADPKSIKIQ